MPKPIPQPVAPFVNPDVEEERNVHEVYEAIAPHFSQTRFKPWPLISAFLSSLPKNALGLDTGGGNGKYLPVAHSHGLEMIETDRSLGLLKCARGMGWGSSPDSTPVNGADGQKQDTGSDVEDREGGQKKENLAECVRGDLCGDIWRQGTFDFAISIAAIHHLSTDERRRHSVKTIMKPLKLNKKGPYSRFMIYVWAYEQGEASKRKMGSAAGSSLPLDSASNPEPTEAVEGAKDRVQDVLVPWVLAPKKGETSKKVKQPRVRAGREGKQGKKGALAGQEVATSQLPSESTISPSETTDKPSQTSTIPETPTAPTPAPEPQPQPLPADEPAPQVFHRYYHLFVQGELQTLVESAAREEGYKIVPSVPYSTTEGMEAAQVGLEGLAIDGDVGEGEERKEGKKWMKVRGVGWEMDNWWLEGEVGVW